MAIDDFGVGASSLARLRRLPVAVVKIDKSLVDHVPDGHVASSLLDAVVGMVRALQLRTIIEGVERADQADASPRCRIRPRPGLPLREADGRRKAWTRTRLALARSTAGASCFLWKRQPDRSRNGRRAAASSSSTMTRPWASSACRILERHGLRTVLVPPFERRWPSFEHITDVMVVDIGMPDGDGWEPDHARAPSPHARTHPDRRDDRAARQRRSAQPSIRPRAANTSANLSRRKR